MPSPPIPSRSDRAQAPLPTAPLGDGERLACLRLIRSENVGPVTFRQLINHFGGAQPALDALPELARRAGRRSIRVCPVDTAEAELEASRQIGVQPLFTIEPGYPRALASLDHPPPLLYVRGRTELLNEPGIAIVGSRDCSASGHAFAQRLAADLGRAGLVVISGLARGIDGAAHHAAKDTGTIAVVAGGLDIFYPPEHRALQEELGVCGCVVGEQPPGFVPRGKDFPRRNRIISGMSYGVVVVEAAKRSGTLTTARLANEQGREVFAVPGHPLDPRAAGTNELIKSGATLVTSADDVMDMISPMLSVPRPVPSAEPYHSSPATEPALREISNDVRGAVERCLGPAPVHTDDILRATGLAARDVQIALLELSLAGRLEHHGAQLVSLRPT